MTGLPVDTGLLGLLHRGLRHDPSRPFLTYYDDHTTTGGRTELSWTTMANWVDKTANLLRDGLAVAPGDRVALLLPVHWQTAVLVLASAAVGAHTVLADPGVSPGAIASAAAGAAADAEVAFAAADLLPEVIAQRPGEVLGLSLAPLGTRMAAVPAGALDFAGEVPAYGDTFAAVPADQAAATLEIDGTTMSGFELSAAAEAAARRWSLGRTDRVLSTLPWSTWAGLHAGMLAPLAAEASAVLCPGGAVPAHRLTEERVTAVAGSQPPFDSACRRLDG